MTIQANIDIRGVAVLMVDNSAKLNTLGSPDLQALIETAERIGADASLRAVVLRGAGERAFIGGADINEMVELDPRSGRDFIGLVHNACDAIRRIPVPVIARLQGYTLGAGLEIAASCDLRVAEEDSRLGMPEVRVGIPSVVEAALLPALIGWGRTRRLLLTGETINAKTALRWGLVEEIAPAAALDEAIERTLGAILACGPRAIRLQKALIAAWEGLSLSEAISRGIDSFAEAWESEEPRRMMMDFLAAQRRRKQTG